jgi:hypothetical protein
VSLIKSKYSKAKFQKFLVNFGDSVEIATGSGLISELCCM